MLKGQKTWHINEVPVRVVRNFVVWISKIAETGTIVPISLGDCQIWNPLDMLQHNTAAKTLGVWPKLWDQSLFTMPKDIYTELVAASPSNRGMNEAFCRTVDDKYPTWLTQLSMTELLGAHAYMGQKQLGEEAASAWKQIVWRVNNLDLSFTDTLEMSYCIPQSDVFTVAVNYVALKMWSAGNTQDPDLVTLNPSFQPLIDRYEAAFQSFDAGQ